MIPTRTPPLHRASRAAIVVAALALAASAARAMDTDYQCIGYRPLSAELTPREGRLQFEGHVWKLRRVLSGLEGQQALELLMQKLRQTKTNVEFLMEVNRTTPTASGLRGSNHDGDD